MGFPDPWRVAGLHQHPLFHTAAEMNAMNGCLNRHTYTSSDVGPENAANVNFSNGDDAHPADRQAIAALGEGKSLYLRVPNGTVIKRTESSASNGTVTQVYP
jgi:hypothetical protein